MCTNWLRRFLKVRWLRPENAMWRTASSRAMGNTQFEDPSLDLGCGDGITSFIRAGGDFSLEFDIFTGVGDLDDFFEDEDIYNASPDEYSPKISEHPSDTISVGLDHKQDLLNKANKLDFYNELIQHDNNKPLPFSEDHFQSIFSNAVYWIDNVDFHLQEINRVLDQDGEAVLVLRTPHVHQFLNYLHSQEDILGEELVDMIDRGRSQHYPSLNTENEWSKKLTDAGFRINEVKPVISTTQASIWDIGLRPISPLTIKMANALELEQRRRIKEEWIDVLERMLSPISDPMFEMEQNDPPAELIYYVEPS